ncbi:MAG TPA: IclR family transcriptional regulator [Herbaspirillum sp.]|jgi:DNA-binding IclR family transcriptional regulator
MTVHKRGDKDYKSSTFVIALARGFEVLRCFDAKQRDLTTMDIAKSTGLPQSTVWRLCNTLVELGCLVRHPNSDRLSIGLGLLGFGYSALPSPDLGELATIEMKRLADEFHAGVSLCIPDKLDMLIVKRVRGNEGLLSGGAVGTRVPMARSAAGWAYLATLSAADLAALSDKLEQQAGDKWIEVRSIIDDEFRRYKEKGFLVNAGVYRPEINYVSVPIVIDSNVYTLHCSALASVLPASKLKNEVGPRLVALADRMRPGLARNDEIY